MLSALEWFSVCSGDPPGTGYPRLIETPPGAAFYWLTVVTLMVSAMSFVLVRYEDKEARWGARTLVSLVLAGAVLLLAYWGALIGTS
ncbi:MAG: hypothetical protein GDA50_08550 [Alphaproteobacteria bacterium GM202ARS2]|nr:hypothetical protein [Alphaproteobacteria bacterium GM202ARS2]